MTVKIAPKEIDEHGNLREIKKKGFMKFVNVLSKIYLLAMFAFNAYSIYDLLVGGTNIATFLAYSLLFIKQLILAIFLLPFLETFGSMFLIKTRSFIKNIKVKLSGQFSRALLYSVPVSLLAVGVLIGLSFLSTFAIFGTLDLQTALNIVTSFNNDTTYIFKVSFWLSLNVLNYFVIFIIIGYIATRVSWKYKLPKVYIVFCTICLSFPVMWILLPATHYLVYAAMTFISSGQNLIATMVISPIIPSIPTATQMTPWLLLNSALGGMWGFITFVPVFFLVTIRSFVSLIGIPDFTGFLGINYPFFPSLYYQNFIFLLNFSLFFMGAIVISYYTYFVKELNKKRRRKKFKRRH